MTSSPVYILGGHQTDFARNAARAGDGLFELMREAVQGALADARLEARDIEAGHVGNFVGELFTGQGQLGGMLAAIDPGFDGTPAGRHEAACASGSIALLAASAEIECGRYDCVLVTGVELERNVPGAVAAQHLGAATWVGQEGKGATYVWPHMFHLVGQEYERRFGLKYEHLARIAEINIGNARRNPLAQTRDWRYTDASFTADDEANPVIEGMIRRQDCGQVTDGAAAVVLASPRFAQAWAARHGLSLDAVPRIAGWGHRTAHLQLAPKLQASAGQPYVFPHVREAIQGAFRRAGVADVFALDGIETHDCFTTTEYMAIDHFGLTAPGQSWRAIEDGTIAHGGRLPINPSGGLIGLGHPVGATGVRMVLDAARQVTGRAGACQVEGARRFATLNIGGSATTVVSFVVEAS
ncbi:MULTISPECIES: acetyl-CoA acetyltransferase [unclassified Variovorax]|uniref:acetyl-CoA acetyltransferase n=1 Tax=unclassified Variovorax TaxID=663243 RepID=UPI002574E6BF|nr:MULTISPECIES: acetyl-CoA acetyltransferase [unclassified Variovorax]MDM0089903.1 acetyl-CoA acetyltransferase [Variovorax sp. J22G40]MDM0148431.1 acetyl-CoA acetyltransferase [Variovorax sp. J2P1-31]